MGLDGVEFVMAVEEAFQIAISDSDSERMVTPRNVVDYILDRLGGSEDRMCMEQRAFYKLRSATMRVFGVARSEVTPDTNWNNILPARLRRHNWKLLQEATGIAPWPSLKFWGRYPATVGATARYLSNYAPAALMGDAAWSRNQVEDAVRRLMHEQLGIQEFEWDDEFVRDFGVD